MKTQVMPARAQRLVEQALDQRAGLYRIRFMGHAAHEHCAFVDKGPNVLLCFHQVGDAQLTLRRCLLSHAGVNQPGLLG